MAFGFGFDKAKILQAAEKYVIQGKYEAAIGEYQKLLKKDPQDLLTLNTIGDLYARVEKTEEALRCFYDLAEKSVEAGYLPRAIAVYKRITKIDSESFAAVLKLGELYSMQGLLRDARTYYLQAVELCLKRKEKEKAREVFEKVLLLDMDNPRLQLKMAELYAETGKKEEAVATYLSAVERFLDRNEPSEAKKALEALVRLDPQHPEGKVLQGRLLVEQGEYAQAIATLEALPSEAQGKGALNWLFHAYMKQGKAGEARDVATRLFDSYEDFAGLAQVCEAQLAQGNAEEALEIYSASADRLVALHASSALVEGLRTILVADHSHIGALELLWKVRRQAGDRGEAGEAGELLAHAYVTHNELEKARDLYTELARMEPDNPELQKLLRQVQAKLGGTEVAEPAAAAITTTFADLETDREAPSAAGEARSAREEEIVKNCLTESDLYLTYRQFAQAIAVLEEGLEKIPGDITLQEHLLRVCEQAQQYEKAAACAEALTEAYIRLGDGERASRYGELTLSFQQKAAEAPAAEIAPTPKPAAEESGGAEVFPPAAESRVREVDLSSEWTMMSGTETAPSADRQADNAVEEIEFYLQAGLASEAAAALRRLEEVSPDHAAIGEFHEKLAAQQGETAPPAEEAATIPAAELASEEVPEVSWAAPAAEAEASVPEAVEEAEEIAPVPLEAPGSELAATPAPAPEHPDLALEELFSGMQPAGAASDFELSLGEAAAKPEAPPASKPVSAGAAAESRVAPGDLLDEVFAEFKDEVEESAAASEDDIETHYNMGIAFREMALYDEAIGEFQKVHQLTQKAGDFSRLVLCCSLLATCFTEKGMPELAVTWYRTALNSAGLDPESRVALLYEVGASYENAGNREEALKSYLEVYAHNIDYRNVADRIRDLQQSK